MGLRPTKIKKGIEKLNHGFSDLQHGVRIHYVEKGQDNGLPVIFIHGFPDSWNSFRLVLDAFSSSFHSFVLDLRGFGESGKPEGGYTQDNFVEDVIAFLDKQSIAKASIVGHSMGSFIAQRLALLYPERVEKLVLIGSASKGKGNPVLDEALEIVNTLQDPLDTNFITEFQSGTIKKNVTPEFFDSIIQESLKAPVRIWKEALKSLTETDYSKELGHIKSPTLIAWGTYDTIFPEEEQEILYKVIPNATLRIYRSAGHSLIWEEAELFAADLERFLHS